MVVQKNGMGKEEEIQMPELYPSAISSQYLTKNSIFIRAPFFTRDRTASELPGRFIGFASLV
ncbi:MAG: hypothetical protein D5R96_06460 [Methanocalculus sp. MSAO_Arc2]|uniref:hypothetical protein n=1 Tax=Methanocalculus sp. MSAO_Arc2 TaxID=2293855 RepID=UPI000FEF73C6|nr:MAG: hypothetical protein D5R96_06460 [Methanocalculus sp. MSAO_Arc2]